MELSTGTIEAHCMSDCLFFTTGSLYVCTVYVFNLPYSSRHWESSGLAMELSTDTIEAYCCMSVCL